MPSFVISRDTLSVNLSGGRLLCAERDPEFPGRCKRIELPLFDIDRVVVVGRPLLSVPVLQTLMKKGIPAFFVSSRGRWIGSLLPDNNRNAARRIRQYELARDYSVSLEVARKLVRAKVKNSRRVIQRLAANRKLSGESYISGVIESLGRLLAKLEPCVSLDSLRGFEGMAAADYFACLGSFFPDKLPFSGRSRRPPGDPANALLSWTYSIVQGEIDSVLRIRGFDPCIGFYHAIEHGTPSLALDLLEPFRAPLCDMLVLHLFNHGILGPDDFRFDASDGGTYLKDSAKRDFFFAYENSVSRKFTPYGGGDHISFRKAFDLAVDAVVAVLEKKIDDVGFFLMP